MSPVRLLSGVALAVLTLAGALATSQNAKAEDLVDFLWGGTEEFGGGRQVTSFNPKYKPGQIIVSFSDRRLYLITAPGKAITYPVAVPKGDARWQGVTVVSNKRINPPWTPTPEMVRANPRLPRWVPGGHPMNPLGVRAMYLGSSAYRIHGTDAPWTIGQAVSHGCIRMTNKDVLDLYPRVPVGTRVTVTWQSFSGRPIASNEPVYGTDGDDDSRPANASYSASNSDSNFSDDFGDQSDDAPRATRHTPTGLSIWDQEGRRPSENKRKAVREQAPKKARAAETASASVTKASITTDEKPAVTKAVATSEKPAAEPAKASPGSEKSSAPKTASEGKPAKSVSATDKPAEHQAASKPRSSHDAKPVAKNFKPVADPVQVKKPAAAEKKASNDVPEKQKTDITALAD